MILSIFCAVSRPKAKTATSNKEKLTATIAKLTSDSEAASQKIDDLAASIAGADQGQIQE